MPVSRKARSKRYQSRAFTPAAGLGTLLAAIVRTEDARPLADAQVTDLAAAYWLALDAMARGACGEEEWSVVTCALNVALVLAERGIGAEHEQELIAALDGAFRAKVRAHQKGVWRFDGEALLAIRAALGLHDQQIAIASKAELRGALIEVHSRIERGVVYEMATPERSAGK